jgi:hypothetical protein
MTYRKSGQPSPVTAARALRQQLARDDGAQAMVEVEQAAIAARKNMKRLRALREEKEVQDRKDLETSPVAKPAKKSKQRSLR